MLSVEAICSNHAKNAAGTVDDRRVQGYLLIMGYLPQVALLRESHRRADSYALSAGFLSSFFLDYPVKKLREVLSQEQQAGAGFAETLKR